jgi:hypothetical protein
MEGSLTRLLVIRKKLLISCADERQRARLSRAVCGGCKAQIAISNGRFFFFFFFFTKTDSVKAVLKDSLYSYQHIITGSRSSTPNDILNGPNRPKDPSILRQYDIVVTTYGTVVADLTRSRNILERNNWYRLVLDEGTVHTNTQRLLLLQTS